MDATAWQPTPQQRILRLSAELERKQSDIVNKKFFYAPPRLHAAS
jgi:hypothetical protein